MPASPPPSNSPRRRTRHWSHLACVAAVAAGLLTLTIGHPMQGWLMILGGLMLLKDTLLGKRSRRHPHGHRTAAEPQADEHKWRKAA